MHFDDRLATVLRSRNGGEGMARILYRQLLDLLGTMPVDAEGPQVDAACDRLHQLAASIPATARAAMLREPGTRLRNPRLVAMLAADDPVIAAAAIESAQLGEEEWIDLAPALPSAARALVGRRRDIGPRASALFDRLGMMPPGLPGIGEAVIEAEATTGAANRPKQQICKEQRSDEQLPGDIGAIVQRIEHFRKSREPVEGAAQPLHGKLPERQPVRLKAFDFATDAEGCIVWSDPGMAPMALGLRLASHDMSAPSSARASLAMALRHRQPVRGLVMDLAGAPAISGRWQIDAAPSFDPASGAYRGHTGRMRREAQAAAPLALALAEADSEADRMRQLLHELRTPVNAVQGFSEVIQQQLFGPAPHEYRALAASVASDAAQVLAGLEELERLARLESGRMTPESGGSALAGLVGQAVNQLRTFTQPRGSGFALDFADGENLPAELGTEDAERLIWRLLATFAGAAAPGEVLALSLPHSLGSLDDTGFWQALAAPASKALSAGAFGAGFSLRLARAEVEAAGGTMSRDGGQLIVNLPGLTSRETQHSDDRAQG
jgi:two-component system OmpR family sensor kinase